MGQLSYLVNKSNKLIKKNIELNKLYNIDIEYNRTRKNYHAKQKIKIYY